MLVAVPAVLGVALASGVFAAVGWPALDRVDQQRQRIAELESKRATLPLLEAQLKQSDQALREAMQQQALLVDLVAGRGQIQTFLAQLSRISAVSGVVINLYEPVPESSPPATNRGGSRDQNKKGTDSATANKDPLQALGYQKSSVLLQVEGPYQGLLQFLRGMEQLELLVQPSDLELTAIREDRYYEKLSGFYAPLRAMIWITTTLVAAGAIFGGLNTLYAAFASRIREMATLQCIGYTRRALLLSFIQESLLATLSGSLLAFVMALMLLDGLDLPFSLGTFTVELTPQIILTGLTTGIALGTMGTLPPALRCLKPSLPVALRSS